VRVAMLSKASVNGKWKYFCGCCWRAIAANQSHAREMLADWDPTASPSSRLTRGGCGDAPSPRTASRADSPGAD
jgi:hypothetical protein